MKNSKYIALLIASIIGIIGIVTFLMINSNNISESDILENEYAQKEMLASIYTDMISSRDINLTLDESALKNLITGEQFSNHTINYLTTVVKPLDSDNSITYTLSTTYSQATNILTIKVTSDTTIETQKFIISVQNGKLSYKHYGMGTVVDSYPAPDSDI